MPPLKAVTRRQPHPPVQGALPMNPLLDRRSLLSHFGTGLAGIALSHLLQQGQLTADDRAPIRPLIDPAQPLSPRTSHFAPKAKNIVMIFCTGALSHIDT